MFLEFSTHTGHRFASAAMRSARSAACSWACSAAARAAEICERRSNHAEDQVASHSPWCRAAPPCALNMTALEWADHPHRGDGTTQP
jgi:hypothetical protein